MIMCLPSTSAPMLLRAIESVRKAMDIILHFGAHRTASTSFQAYLAQNETPLARQGLAVWGPKQTRGGLFAGVWPEPGLMGVASQHKRARGRIALALRKLREAGTEQVIITDENILGTPRQNIRSAALYPAAGERLARLFAAFDGRITLAALSVRSPDSYWASVMAMSVARGHPMPGPKRLMAIAQSPCSWRDVITDAACAMPGTPLQVLPHEAFGATPERRLAAMVTQPLTAPLTHARMRLNAAPRLPQMCRALQQAGRDTTHLLGGDGPFRPFARSDAAALQETYADDLFWLAAGAEGLATLITHTTRSTEGKTPGAALTERGHRDEQKGRVAQAG